MKKRPRRCKSNGYVMDRQSIDSARIMKAVDGMSAPMRALVHEYGFSVVNAMLAEGYTNAKTMRWGLEEWRRRRQDELLK